MSNIPANNPHDCRTASSPVSTEPEEPEPSRPNDLSSIDVQTVWDEAVAPWRTRLGLTDRRIARAVRQAAKDQGFDHGEVGVRVTDDHVIHEINRRHLDHDYPTDVISFSYSERSDRIEGELVVSIETAEANAVEAGWTEMGWETADELLLYVIHGTLHIAGMDDHEPVDRKAMRDAEGRVLESLGMKPDPNREGRRDG